MPSHITKIICFELFPFLFQKQFGFPRAFQKNVNSSLYLLHWPCLAAVTSDIHIKVPDDFKFQTLGTRPSSINTQFPSSARSFFDTLMCSTLFSRLIKSSGSHVILYLFFPWFFKSELGSPFLRHPMWSRMTSPVWTGGPNSLSITSTLW